MRIQKLPRACITWPFVPLGHAVARHHAHDTITKHHPLMIGTSSIVANDWAAASSVRLNPSDQATASYRLWWCCLKLISLLLDWSKKLKQARNTISLWPNQPNLGGDRSTDLAVACTPQSLRKKRKKKGAAALATMRAPVLGGGAPVPPMACAQQQARQA